MFYVNCVPSEEGISLREGNWFLRRFTIQVYEHVLIMYLRVNRYMNTSTIHCPARERVMSSLEQSLDGVVVVRIGTKVRVSVVSASDSNQALNKRYSG